MKVQFALFHEQLTPDKIFISKSILLKPWVAEKRIESLKSTLWILTSLLNRNRIVRQSKPKNTGQDEEESNLLKACSFYVIPSNAVLNQIKIISIYLQNYNF